MLNYLYLGLYHVLDFNAFDHMLFICIMLVNLDFSQWKKALTLITAFTIGHSITLATSIIFEPIISSEIVEVAIPFTILLTAVFNALCHESEQNIFKIYAFALLFGFIHGMGFASYLRILIPDNTEFGSLLLFFNVGVELAQILISFIFLSLTSLLKFLPASSASFTRKLFLIISILISLLLAIQNIPFQ